MIEGQDKLVAAIGAHLHGAPMAHHVGAELRIVLNEVDIIDSNTELMEYDVVRLHVCETKQIVVKDSYRLIPVIDKRKLPKYFPKQSGGLASGCLWSTGRDEVLEISYETGNRVYFCLESNDVWAVLSPRNPTGTKNCVFALSKLDRLAKSATTFIL